MKSPKISGLLVLTAMLGLAHQAQAANYGMAGCGLGALAFKDQPGMIQIAAGILNNIISPQTSAITSGTSNCSDAGSDSALNEFIDGNRDSLKTDIARGQGESLSGLLSMMGCADTQVTGSTLQSHYGQIFNEAPIAPAADINSHIKSVIRTNNLSCKAVI